MAKSKMPALAQLQSLRAVPPAQKCGTPALLADLCNRAQNQFATVCAADRENAIRGLFLGLLFWQIKNESGHGNFERTAKERLSEIPKRTRVELMKLTRHFVESARIALPEQLAIPDAQTALQLGDGTAASDLVAGAVKFVGDLSLHQLMVKWEVRDKKKLGGKRETVSDDDPAEAPDPEALFFQSRDEISGAISRIEGLILKENRLQHLLGHDDDIRGVVAGLRSLADQVEAAAKPLLKPSKK